MFKRIHWILTSHDSPTKFSYNRSLYVEEHCAIIESENGTAKLANNLVHLVDLDDPNDQRQEWCPE